MRSILLHIDNDDCLEARLQVSLDIAREFAGHLTCLQSVPYEFGVPGDLYGTMAIEMMPQVREAASELQNRMEQRLNREDVAWDYVQEDGFASERLLRRCGLSDLVVLGSCDALRPKGLSALLGDMVFKARTPILVVPSNTKRFDSGGAAVVAWDGSPEAARALRAAVPLLAKAGAVHLVSVQEEKQPEQATLPHTEGAEYLSRHGIDCEIVEMPCGGTIGETILSAAAARNASCIVMGAYGRPRLVEVIWGGATRQVLLEPPVPILVCH